jgi:hypothetical protein
MRRIKLRLKTLSICGSNLNVQVHGVLCPAFFVFRAAFFFFFATRCCGGLFATTSTARSNVSHGLGSSSISPFALFFGGAMMPTSQKRKHSNAGLPNNLLQAVGHVAVLWGQIEYIIDRPLSPWSGIGLSQNQTVLESAKLDDFSPGNGIFLQSIVLRRFSIVWEK